jgi:hypothetical protein
MAREIRCLCLTITGKQVEGVRGVLQAVQCESRATEIKEMRELSQYIRLMRRQRVVS